MISPQYEFSDVLQDDKSARKSYHTCCIEMASPVFVINSLWFRNLFVIIIANVDTMFIYLLYSYNIFILFMLMSYINLLHTSMTDTVQCSSVCTSCYWIDTAIIFECSHLSIQPMWQDRSRSVITLHRLDISPVIKCVWYDIGFINKIWWMVVCTKPQLEQQNTIQRCT